MIESPIQESPHPASLLLDPHSLGSTQYWLTAIFRALRVASLASNEALDCVMTVDKLQDCQSSLREAPLAAHTRYLSN
jgi:hypothetical protein